MYVTPGHVPRRPRRGCLSGPCSCGCSLPLVAIVLLFGISVAWYLKYSELRMATSGRQPVVVSESGPTMPSPDRHICREVRPRLVALAQSTSLGPFEPKQQWLLLLDRNLAADWLVVTDSQQGIMWLPMESVIDLADIGTYADPAGSGSATYLMGLVAYDASTGQFTVDPQAFSAFVAASAAFRECPPALFAELGANWPSSPEAPAIAPEAQDVTPEAQDVTPPEASPSREEAAPGPAGWTGIVNIGSNLRTGPSTDSSVVRVLPVGTEVVVVGVSDDGEWLELENGTWIYSSLVTREGNGATAGVSIVEDASADASDGPVPGTGSAPATDAVAATEPIGNGPPDFRPEADRLEELRLHMLELINRERSLRGLESVVMAYNEGAQLHAEDLAENRYMSHWNLRGETPAMRHTWAGGHDYSVENLSFRSIADAPAGFCAPPVSEQVLNDAMAGLMDSPGHRDNILRPYHREVNIGIANSCQAMVVAQVFEGEYVRFSLSPELVGGRLAMAGQVTPEVNLNDRTNVVVNWDPPLADYTRGQVSQTFCYSPGRPVAYIPRPLPDGFYWLEGESREMDWEHCPAPWDANPNLQLPGNEAEIDQLRQQIRDGFLIRKRVDVALVTADIWQVEADSFRIEADLNQVIQTHGPGIYSMVLWGDVDGESVALTEYAIEVER